MKKLYFSILSLIAITVFLILPYEIEASGVDNIGVKIGKTYALLDRAVIGSEDGFKLLLSDKDDPVMSIDSARIYISTNFSDAKSIDVFDDKNNYIATLPADGTLMLGTDEGSFSIAGIKYRGYLSFISSISGMVLVNQIDVESYLYGVVPKEIPVSSSVEALKAQAVAARSFVFNSLKKHASEGYNLCDTTHCQVYGGMSSEHPNTNLAVDETFGIVATYNGNPANTVYHSSSGGFTESSEKVWGGKVPYLSAVQDSYSLTGPNANWSLIIDTEDLESKLQESGSDIGRLDAISIVERSESGRVVSLEILGSRGSRSMSGSQFRSLIGASTLKSTLFYVGEESSSNVELHALDDRRTYIIEPSRRGFSVIGQGGVISNNSEFYAISSRTSKSFGDSKPAEINDGEILISGKGFGHGVGMSQYGAIEMAKQGFRYEEILKHYYRDIELTNFYR